MTWGGGREGRTRHVALGAEWSENGWVGVRYRFVLLSYLLLTCMPALNVRPPSHPPYLPTHPPTSVAALLAVCANFAAITSIPTTRRCVLCRGGCVGLTRIPRIISCTCSRFPSPWHCSIYFQTVGTGSHSTAYDAAKYRHAAICELPAAMRCRISQGGACFPP